MTDSFMIEKAREFVSKFNNDEYDFVKTTNEDHQDTLERLASAKVDFEKADNDHSKGIDPITVQILPALEIARRRQTLTYNFEHTLESLLKWMGIAKVNNLYQDSKIKKEIEEFKINKSKIEEENESLRKLNEKLSKESIRFRDGLSKIFAEFQEIDAKYGWLLENPKIGESKLD